MNLFWLSLQTRWKMLKEYLHVVVTDYKNKDFRRADLKLLGKYLFDSPYTISKQWAIDHDEEQVYTYGETPIPGLRTIVEKSNIVPTDHVFELGCGRGRACIWMRYVIGCQVTGIECIEEFIRRAKSLQDDRLSFICQDFLASDLSNATVIYLNGTMLSRRQIQKLTEKLSTLPEGTKVITVSYPLTQYSAPGTFYVLEEFQVEFHWGVGTVYLQVVRGE